MSDDRRSDEFPAVVERSTLPGESGRWKILIIDDEEEVHTAIESALANIVFDNKGMQILSAYSAKVGRGVLLEHPDTAVLFLGGVLERASSGLDLVKFIREERQNSALYIIMRIGHPDLPPVRKMVGIYEINDFRDRSEFSIDMIYAMGISGLRFYKASRSVETTCQELEKTTRDRTGELTALERLYQVLMETMNEGVGIQDKNGVLTYVNPRFSGMLGFQSGEMIGKPTADFLDDINQRIFLNRKTDWRKNKTGSFEIEWTGKDDARIPTLVTPRNIFDSNGKVKGSFAVITDRSELEKTEKALRNSESRYRNVYHTAPLAFVIWDKEGRITAWNKHAEMIFGWSRKEVLGRNILEFMVPSNVRPHVEAIMEELLHGIIVNHSVNENLTKSGEVILCEWNNSILYDGEGNISGAISLAMDITERGRTEKALRDSEDAYRTLAENLPGMVYRVYLGENKRIRFLNNMSHPITGRTVEELESGKHRFLEHLILPEDRAGVVGALEKAVAENTPFEVEYRLRKKNGDITYLKELGRPVYGTEGEPLYIDGVILDINAHKLAEKALKESEAQKNAILDGITTNIRFVNTDFEMLWANWTAAFSVDKSPAELIGRKCYEIWGKEDCPHPDCPATKVLETKKTERSILHFSDNKVWDVKAEPVFNDEGKVEGVVQISREVTEKHSLDTQLRHAQKMESIGALTSGVAHNFKNILAGISMDSQLIQMLFEDNEQLLEIVKRTDASAKRGARLITELMKFSRKERKKFQTVNLTQVIQETHELIRKSFDKMIDIRVDVPSSLLVVGDHGGLSQVLMNLCTNARDAMPRGGKLGIKAWREEDKVRVEISDEGCGMDEETREKCFIPFFTTKDIDRGTGLGLSTTYGIVKDHGGYIHVDSEPGKGAAFKLSFPVASSKTPVEEEKNLEIKRGSGEKILIIDDEMSMLQSLKKLLIIANYQVDDVTNGINGLAKYKDWRPDVVLLDRNMPGMNGSDCAEKIIAHDPDANILLISGYADQGPYRLDDHVKSIIKGYLSKPVGIGELSQELSKLLHSRREGGEGQVS
ncbi:MAG: PAS domain S-box protein [Desulfobacterales bacterium]|nr:PAS domain S-box protein [Desulfobacterales bacterium]